MRLDRQKQGKSRFFGSLSGPAERLCLAALLPLEVRRPLTVSKSLASVQESAVDRTEVIRMLTGPRLECRQPDAA